MSKSGLILFTDGGSRGNPGPAGCGVVITDEQGQVIKKTSKALGVMTNNEAEYWAVITGLETVKKMYGQEKLGAYVLEVRLDSELVCRQLLGEYQVKEERLWPLFMKIWNMQIKDVPRFACRYIPREKNKLADLLANEAMDEQAKPKLFS
jgi:ribonuclease HI